MADIEIIRQLIQNEKCENVEILKAVILDLLELIEKK